MNLTRIVFLLVFATTAMARGSWEFQDSHATNASFRGVCAVSSNVVWAAGSGGTCLGTLDGGQNWERRVVTGAETLDFRGVHAFDDRTAILMSAGEAEKGAARIYRTSDSGQTWGMVFETAQKGVFLDDIAFWDTQNGLVCGDPIDGKWYLLQTADAGRTWNRLTPTNLPSMLEKEAAFAAGNSSMVLQGNSNAWIASGGGERARVFRSVDRGQNWEVHDTPMPAGETAGIFGMRFWNPLLGMGIGGDHKKEHMAPDNVIVTWDGGLTWRKATATDPPGLKETVVLLRMDTLLAVGPSGTCLSRDWGTSWQKVDLSPFHSASCAQGECWAVGGKGVIARWRP